MNRTISCNKELSVYNEYKKGKTAKDNANITQGNTAFFRYIHMEYGNNCLSITIAAI